MLSQHRGLHTLFVPEAVSETVAPQSLKHYLSQRRRWGSNSYFNSFFYLAGENMSLVVRAGAASDIIRQTFVYYRVISTIVFIKTLAEESRMLDVLPILIVGQLPVMWYTLCLFLEPELRRRMHKLVLGFLVNEFVSPFLAISIFTMVAINLGKNGNTLGLAMLCY